MTDTTAPEPAAPGIVELAGFVVHAVIASAILWGAGLAVVYAIFGRGW